MYVSWLVVLCSIVVAVHGYGSGAPAGVCEDMTPKHPAEPQKTPSPYKITASSTNVKGGSQIQITVSGGPAFKGYFVQCRHGNNPVGEFSTGPATKTVKCGNQDKSAATHNSPSDKKQVVLTWKAPKNVQGQIQCLATVAKNGGEFWVAQKGPVLNVTK